MDAPNRPLLVYDADCGFCKFWTVRWIRAARDRLGAASYQAVAHLYPTIPVADFENAVHYIEPDGTACSGAEAAYRALAWSMRWRALLWLYTHLTLFRQASDGSYAFVASRRSTFSGLTFALWGRDLAPSTHTSVATLFLRSLALVYLAAFGSLWLQIDGLIGEQGIAPATDLMASAAEQLSGFDRWRVLPTLAWFGASNAILQSICALGTASAIVLLAGLAPKSALIVLYVSYLSLVGIGRPFLWFQWDSLLLETGFLAIFLAPRGIRLRWPGGVPTTALWMQRLLLFKLMWLSGAVKLASGDVTWRNLTALELHFETQPIPTPLAWFAHQLPDGLLSCATAIMFTLELVIPFSIFGPRRVRGVAFGLLALLQVMILLTGNYTFFNWLTLALCLTLLDDAQLPWRRTLRTLDIDTAVARVREQLRTSPAGIMARSGRALRVSVSLLWVVIATQQLARPLGAALPWADTARRLSTAVAPFGVANPYGLFAVMTTTRPEIIIEGSNDGQTWLPYTFRYMAGDVDRAPPWVAPHQPRLDWQMWFAALGSYEQNPWFARLCGRLLEGSPAVVALLESNPFEDAPPRQLRAVVYEYRFTDWNERSATGAWWTREPRGLYAGPLSLR